MNRRSFILALSLALSLLASGCTAGSASANDATKNAAPLRLRILTYNIHHAEGNDGKFDLERIAKVILAAKPDLVALQEVDVKTRRASGVDQAAELGRLTGMHSAFGKAMDFAGGQYGEAVLSRWKFVSTKNVALPFDEGFEPRAAMSVVVRIHDSGPAVTFAGTHLDHASADLRLRQAKKLNEAFAADDTPVILAGDLNASPSSKPMQALFEKWTSAAGDKSLPTFPAQKPRIAIDHVLFRPAGRFRVVSIEVIDEKVASDHAPLLAVLEYIRK